MIGLHSKAESNNAVPENEGNSDGQGGINATGSKKEKIVKFRKEH